MSLRCCAGGPPVRSFAPSLEASFQMKMFLFLASGLVAAGCASTIPFSVGPDHPASPSADASPFPVNSTTLSIPASSRVAAPASVVGDAGHNHDGHGAAGHTAGSAGAATPTPTSSGKPVAQDTYVCPMHPEVVSSQPGSRCPDCKMKLVKKGGGR